MNTQDERRSTEFLNDGSVDPWNAIDRTASLSLGRIAGVELGISYSVLLAAAATFAGVIFFSSRSGNADLLPAALAGTTVWIAGLVIQLATAVGYAAFSGLRIRGAVIGLVGIELPVHRWPPKRTMMLVIVCLLSLLAMGMVIWSVGAMISSPTQVPSPAPITGESSVASQSSGILVDPTGGLRIPSYGFGPADEPWQASAWLIWFQACCQLVPMPRTLGRLGLLSTIGWLDRSNHPAHQVSIASQTLRAIAAAAMLTALMLLALNWNTSVPGWFLLGVFAGLMWVSAGHRDIVRWLDSFSQNASESGATDTCDTLGEAVRQWSGDRRIAKQIQQAHHEEVAEAVDVARLDEILDQLHRDGPDSLSSEETQVLQRVSETLRKHRDDS